MHNFDHSELARYLASHVDGFGDMDSIEKFTGGQSNPTYKVTSGSKAFVLRTKPTGKLLPSAHAVHREFRVMAALNGHLPVPRMLHLSAEASPLGPQFFVMELVDGQIHWDPGMPSATRQDRIAVYDAMNAMLAKLHSLDPVAVGLADFGKPGNYFNRQLSRWVGQYRAAQTKPDVDVDWIIDWLGSNMPADDEAVAIVHGDYRIDNIIFGPDNDPRALLDWELSTLGHPLADLAYQVMVWRLPNAGQFKGLGGLDRGARGLPGDADYIAAYAERRGMKVPENWNFYLAFTCFRFLAILQGVLKRGLDGTASNPAGLSVMEKMVDLLAKEARAIAGN
ncbi:MAG: phosphotransferase family protein [Pseudomonadota bacterium]